MIGDHTYLPDRDVPSSSSFSKRYPRTSIVSEADRQDETEDIGLESMRNLEKQPRGSSVRFYQYPPIRIDTQNLRKALSGL
jgi:hypothetical protein